MWAEQTGTERRELAPFDSAGALGRTALLRGLERPDLDQIAMRLRSFVLQPGESIGDESGGLVIVRAGRYWHEMSVGDEDLCALPMRTWPDAT